MRRLPAWISTGLLLAGLAPGCGGSSSTQPASGLTEGTGSDWILEAHPVFKTVRFAFPRSGGVPLAAGPRAGAVIAFLDRYKSTFGMSAPLDEWAPTAEDSAADGASYLRFQQRNRGVDVYGAEWLATVDGQGKLTSMSGTYVPGLDAADLTTTLGVQQAEAVAQADVQRRVPSLAGMNVMTESAPSPALYVPDDGAPTLVFSVSTQAIGATDADVSHYLIDARSGAVVSWGPTALAATATGYGAAHYPPFSDGSAAKSFPVNDAPPYVMDGHTSSGVPLLTEGWVSSAAVVMDATASLNQWTDPIVPAGAAVDAQSNFAAVIDAYHALFGRSSFDANGGNVSVTVNWNGLGTVNARYIGFGECKGVFGVGDGDAFLGIFPMGASPDVVAHEFTHAVSACTWGGVWKKQELPVLAIDEAMSDILAVLVASSLPGGQDSGLFGKGVATGKYVRDLGQPHDPQSLDNPMCDSVSDGCTQEGHALSGIISYAWYLMTEGGKHETNGEIIDCPIGWEASRKLWYEVLVHKLKQGPDYRDVANATLAAAQEQGLNLRAVGCAWVATEVLKESDLAAWNVKCAGTDGGIEQSATPADGGASGDAGGLALVSGSTQLVCGGGGPLETSVPGSGSHCTLGGAPLRGEGRGRWLAGALAMVAAAARRRSAGRAGRRAKPTRSTAS